MDTKDMFVASPVVAAHQAADLPLLDARLEGRQVRVDEVLLRDVRIDRVARKLHAALRCVLHTVRLARGESVIKC